MLSANFFSINIFHISVFHTLQFLSVLFAPFEDIYHTFSFFHLCHYLVLYLKYCLRFLPSSFPIPISQARGTCRILSVISSISRRCTPFVFQIYCNLGTFGFDLDNLILSWYSFFFLTLNLTKNGFPYLTVDRKWPSLYY